MTRVLQSYPIYVDSRMRAASDPYVNPTFNLTTPIQKTTRSSHFTIRVLDVIIPFSFHGVNVYNSTVQVTLTRNAVSVSTSLTIPTGNYSIRALLTATATALTAAFTTHLTASPTWAFVYSTTTNRVTWSCTDSVTSAVTFAFSSAFELATMYGSVGSDLTVSTTSSVESPFACQVNPINHIFLRCDSLKQRNSYEMITSTQATSNVIASIPIVVTPTLFISYTATTAPPIALVDDIITRLSIYLTGTQTYIDIEQNWSCSLLISEEADEPLNAAVLSRYQPHPRASTILAPLDPAPEEAAAPAPSPDESTPPPPLPPRTHPDMLSLQRSIHKLRRVTPQTDLTDARPS